MLDRILRRRAWVVWVLVLVVVFVQPASGYATRLPVSVTSVSHHRPPTRGLARYVALPSWFDLTSAATTPDPSPKASATVALPAWLTPPPSPLFQQASPSLSKSASVATATLDQMVTYTLVYTIPTGLAPASFSLEDTVPSNPGLIFDTSPGSYSGPTPLTPDTPPVTPVTPTFSNVDRTATWALGVLSNASQNPYVYRVTYRALLQQGMWGALATNSAHLYYDGKDVSASTTITIHRPDMYPRLSVRASNGDWGADPIDGAPDREVADLIRGDVLTVTLSVTNAKPGLPSRWPFLSPAYDMRFHFELPNFLHYGGPVGTTPDPVQDVKANGWTHLDWQGYDELTSLDPLEGLAYVFTATVNMTVTADRREPPLFRVYYRYLPGGAHEPNERTSLLFLLRSRDVTLDKTANRSALLVGDEVTYTVRFIMPDGVSILPPIYLEDTMEDGLEWQRSITATPLFSATPDVSRIGDDTKIKWGWMGGDITETGIYTFSFAAVLSSSLKNGDALPWSTRFNRADLFWRDAFGNGQTTGSNDVYVQVVRPSIPLGKEVWTGSSWGENLYLAAGGEMVRFRIGGAKSLQIRNEPLNTSTAYEIVISDTLPAGFALQDAAPKPYSSTTINGRTVITWGVYISLTPGSTLPERYITATAPITLTPDPNGSFINLAAVFYSDRAGSPPDDNAYMDTNGAEVRSGEMVKVTKRADPSGSRVRIGDPVTFTVAAEIGSGSVLYGPFFADQRVDEGMFRGYHLISGTFSITGGSATPVTITQGAREIVSWTLASPFTNTTGSPHYITSSFQVRYTGVDLLGVPVFASTTNWDHYRSPQRADNGARMYWYLEEGLSNRRDGRDSVFINVVQPLLVDPAFAPEKRLVGGGPTVESGDLITYGLNIYNSGRAPAYDVVISDRLPLGFQFVTYTASLFNPWGGETYTATFSAAPSPGATGVIGWIVDEVNPSNNDPDEPTQLALTYTVRVTDAVGAGATLINGAWISDYSSLPGAQMYERHYDYLPGIGVPVNAPPVSAPGAEIGKTANVNQASLGDRVVFAITVPNTPLGATMYNVVVTDVMPLSPPGPLHVLAAEAPGATARSVTSASVSANYDLIPADAQATIVITARIPITAAGGTVENVASVAWDDAASDGTAHTASSEPVPITIVTPDAVVSKSAPAAASLGSSFAYTIDYGNSGLDTAYDVRLTDTLPVSVTYISSAYDRLVTQTGFAPGPLVWELGSLSPGESGTIWVTVTVWTSATIGGRLVNIATISTPSAGDKLVNNLDTTTTKIGGAALKVEKTAAPDPVQAGDQIMYALVVTNTAGDPTENLVITDQVPLNTSFVDASPGGTLVGNVVTWNPADIAVSERAAVTVAVRVDAPLVSGTQIINGRYGAKTDNAPSPQTDPVTVTVHSQPVLNIRKTAAALAHPGENLVYTITYRNTGNAVAHNVEIVETYDPNVTFVSANPPPDVGQNVWQVGPVTPNGDHNIIVTVHIGDSVPDATLLTNRVTIDSDETNPASVTASTLVSDYALFIPTIMKAYSPPPLAFGVDLTVQGLQVGPAIPVVGQATRVTATLRNLGANTVVDDFWVDLYVDPSKTPSVNVLWNHIAPYGKAWFIHDDVPGGGTLVIHTDQPDDPEDPDSVYSNWPGWFVSAGEHELYVQVDSFGTKAGAVFEDDETDNVAGPLAVTVRPTNRLMTPLAPIHWRERR